MTLLEGLTQEEIDSLTKEQLAQIESWEISLTSMEKSVESLSELADGIEAAAPVIQSIGNSLIMITWFGVIFILGWMIGSLWND